jgi:Methyltransferase domain
MTSTHRRGNDFKTVHAVSNCTFRPNDPNQDAQDYASWMTNNVDPFFSCPHVNRVGGRGDGPKWVCDPHRLVETNDCLIYSIGSAGHYEFEDGMISVLKDNSKTPIDENWKSNCEIHTFDPDPKYIREHDVLVNNIHLSSVGIEIIV